VPHTVTVYDSYEPNRGAALLGLTPLPPPVPHRPGQGLPGEPVGSSLPEGLGSPAIEMADRGLIFILRLLKRAWPAATRRKTKEEL
jgi:hypothetical protein